MQANSQPRELPAGREQLPPIKGFDGEQHAAMIMALADLRYPIGPGGETLMIMEAMSPIVAYHLVRCGWRMVAPKRKIKARRVYGGGMLEDACRWVPIDAPDDPLANLQHMSMADIEGLDDELRAEAKRRLGIKVEPPPPPPGWHTQTKINIDPNITEPEEEPEP